MFHVESSLAQYGFRSLVLFQVHSFLYHSVHLLHRLLHQGQRTQDGSRLWLAVAGTQRPLLLVSHLVTSLKTLFVLHEYVKQASYERRRKTYT